MPLKKQVAKIFKKTAVRRRRRASRVRKSMRKSYRRHRHRRFGRHNNNNKSKTQVTTSRILGGALSADKLRVKLPFRFVNSFSQAANAITYLQLKSNSIYDCAAGSGTQNAQGYLRYYTYFTRSLVHASSIHVRLWSDVTGTGDAEPIQVVVIPCNAAQVTQITTFADFQAIKQQPHAKVVTYIPGQSGSFIKHYSNTQMMQSGTDSTSLTSSQSWSSTSGNDPNFLTSWMVLISGVAGSTSQNIQIDASVYYYTEFFQPILQATQGLTMEGNDFGGTPEEWEEYKRVNARKMVPITAAKKKSIEMKSLPASTPQVSEEFELVRVPKLKTPVPLSR